MTRTKLLSGIAAATLIYTAPVGLVLPAGTPALTAMMPGISMAQAQDVSVDIDFFFDRLEPHGSWVRHDRHRYVWVPDGIDRDWAPYTEGRWVYVEEYGWTFVAVEPFGWATYHYGRWASDREIGWYWVPGTRWAPAWVSWRRGPDYVGWAPLPPEDDGFAVSVEVNIGEIPEDRWWFVPVDDFLVPNLSTVLIPARERRPIYERTEYAGHVVVRNNIFVNTVIDIDFIQERADREVEIHRIERVDDPERATRGDQDEGETLSIFAPQISEPAEEVEYEEAVELEEVAEQRQGQGIVPDGEVEDAAAADGEEQAPAEGEAAEEDAAGEGDAADAAADEEADAEADAAAEVDADAEVEAGEEVTAEGEAEAEAAAELEAADTPPAEAELPEEAAPAAEAATEADDETEEAAEAAAGSAVEAEALPDEAASAAEAATDAEAEAEAAAETPAPEEAAPEAEVLPDEAAPAAEEAAEAAPAAEPAAEAPAPEPAAEPEPTRKQAPQLPEQAAPAAEAAPEPEAVPATEPAAEAQAFDPAADVAPAGDGQGQPQTGNCPPAQQAAGRC